MSEQIKALPDPTAEDGEGKFLSDEQMGLVHRLDALDIEERSAVLFYYCSACHVEVYRNGESDFCYCERDD